MASCYHRNIDDQVTTFDATATTTVIFPCDNLASMKAKISTIAFSPDNNNQKTWEQVVLCKRINGGVAINGALTNLLTPIGDLGAVTWAVQVTTDAITLIVQVVGQAATKINWFVSVWATCVMGD